MPSESEITRQTTPAPEHLRADAVDPTPVWGTGQPLKGLSGWIRRNAYMIPDNRPSHWLMLMAGDRVDVIESAAGEIVKKKPIVAAAAAAAVALALIKIKGGRS